MLTYIWYFPILENFWWFLIGYESVVTRDVQDQIQICTDAMSALQALDIDNYSKWELNHRKFVLATLKVITIMNGKFIDLKKNYQN